MHNISVFKFIKRREKVLQRYKDSCLVGCWVHSYHIGPIHVCTVQLQYNNFLFTVHSYIRVSLETKYEER